MVKKYDAEFKRNTVRKVFDGQSVASVSREIGVSENQIHKWKKAALQNGDGSRLGKEPAETQALQKRVRKLEQENEILKKAALIFGRGN